MQDFIDVSLRVIGVLYGIYLAVMGWLNRNKSIIDGIIQRVELAAVDGIIDVSERKSIVMETIADLEKSGRLKLNFLQRKFISIIVDKIARKLPDIELEKSIGRKFHINQQLKK